MTVVYAPQNEASSPKSESRTSLFPLLVILFLVSYGILTMLVVEQGRTIESQRTLLREMLKDSSQLAALKGKLAKAEAKLAQDKAAEPAQKEPGSGNSAAAPKKNNKEPKRPGKSARSRREIPERPAADLEDVRRLTRVI